MNCFKSLHFRGVTFYISEPLLYALYCGPRREKDPRWVPAVVTKVFGSRSMNVRVFPRGGTWRRHIDQLRPRYGVEEDTNPGEVLAPAGSLMNDLLGQETNPIKDTSGSSSDAVDQFPTMDISCPSHELVKPKRPNPRWPTIDQYGPDNPHRSARRKPHGQ